MDILINTLKTKNSQTEDNIERSDLDDLRIVDRYKRRCLSS